jgi:hypothetical protein
MTFARVDWRDVLADFGGGSITSDAGALLLGATDRAIGLVDRFAACFSDGRMPGRVTHDMATLVGQRVFGIAHGYEDPVDHDDLRRDPALGAAPGRIEARRRGLAPLAGKSTARTGWSMRPRARTATAASATTRPPSRHCSSICSSTPTRRRRADHARPGCDRRPVHGRQEGRFFHGSSDGYCYRRATSSAATTCSRRSCAAPISTPAPARLRRSPASSRKIRARWPRVKILLRADSGFAREQVMAWCEANRVGFLSGLARNARLADRIHVDLAWAEHEADRTGRPARRFADFRWRTRGS